MSETQTDQNDGLKQDNIYKAEDTVKDGWKRVKRFVKDHPTITASAVSAVVSWKLSKRHTIKKMTEEVSTLVYDYGTEAGSLELQRDVLLDFINRNNLGSAVIEHVEHIKAG